MKNEGLSPMKFTVHIFHNKLAGVHNNNLERLGKEHIFTFELSDSV
jgi:hypothetical protein